MNEREMLELAAKAAGYEVKGALFEPGEDVFIGLELSDCSVFNSKENDGDALRLAARLMMQVEPDAVICGRHGLESSGVSRVMCGDDIEIEIEHNGDPMPATRLAITRAAAETGRRTP